MELPKLQRSKAEAKSLIGEQIKRGRQISPLHLGYALSNSRYEEWDKETYGLLLELFDTDRYAREFEAIAEGYVIGDENNRNWRLNFGHRMNRKIELLEESQRRIDKHLAEPTVTAIKPDFWSLIHPDIVRVAKTRFETGYYADSVETALKHVNSSVKAIVQRNTGKELDGADLMRQAFTPNNPVITIETLATDSGRSVQQGFMEIFAGSMTGIRNPKAHQIVDIGPEREIHFIFLASMLMDTLDMASGNYRHPI